MDCERLRRIDGMIAILHGPSLDDGVCMEIGFAAARGVPVVILTTDFQSYGPRTDGPAFVFPEPLLQMLAARVERAYRLAPPSRHPSRDRFSAFRGRNIRPLDAAIDQAVDALLTAAPHATPTSHAQRLAFIEPSPYLPDSEWRDVARQLQARDWPVHVAVRLRADMNTHSAIQADWDAFCRSTLAVVDVRGPEAAPGAALMIGACTATGRPVLAGYTAGWQTFADGREPNWRNLMIQYAVYGRFTSIGELIALTDAL
jgi:hypothetical protein